jgi:hypothetical protein
MPPFSMLYSPECVEGVFSEVHIQHRFGSMIRRMELCPARVPNPKPHIYW